jgi:hypothetical protein
MIRAVSVCGSVSALVNPTDYLGPSMFDRIAPCCQAGKAVPGRYRANLLRKGLDLTTAIDGRPESA